MIGYDSYCAMNVVVDPIVLEPEPAKKPPPYEVDINYALTRFPSNDFARLLDVYSDIFYPELAERRFGSLVANKLMSKYYNTIIQQLPSLANFDKKTVINNINRVLSLLRKISINPDVDLEDVRDEVIVKSLMKGILDRNVSHAISDNDLYSLYDAFVTFSHQPNISQ